MERYKYNSAGEKRSYFTSGTKQDMTQCQTRQGTALILKQTNKQTRKICKAETHNQNNQATRILGNPNSDPGSTMMYSFNRIPLAQHGPGIHEASSSTRGMSSSRRSGRSCMERVVHFSISATLTCWIRLFFFVALHHTTDR